MTVYPGNKQKFEFFGVPLRLRQGNMMPRIIDILQRKTPAPLGASEEGGNAPALSYEFFTPKTEAGRENLFTNARLLVEKARPDFISITYGAGGSTREHTTELVVALQNTLRLPVMHHLTCIGHSRSELEDIITHIIREGIDNILALRGDPPRETNTAKPGESWSAHPEGFTYSCELVALIKKLAPHCSVAGAGFPEGHPESSDLEEDAAQIGHKIAAGAEYLVTQLFFEVAAYTGYLRRLKRYGITLPVIPGILPVSNYQNLLNFTAGCKAGVPQALHDIFAPIQNDEDATRREGIAWAVRQARGLLEAGAPGLHFYTLNKTEPVLSIVRALGLAKS
jgi:methylenetetrahydrofolate reductase (NADPH)